MKNAKRIILYSVLNIIGNTLVLVSINNDTGVSEHSIKVTQHISSKLKKGQQVKLIMGGSDFRYLITPDGVRYRLYLK